MGFLFVLKRIGFFFLDNWKVVLPVVLVLVASIWLYRVWNRPPKLNETEVQRGEAAKKAANDAELRKILIESDVRTKEINENSQDATAQKVEAINESKAKWENASRDELQAEFDRRAGQ